MKLLFAVIFAYVVYAGVFFLAQRRLIYVGAYLAGRDGISPPAPVEQVWLPLSSGRVEAWYLEAGGAGPRPALIFAHGNGELIDHWVEPMGAFVDRGLGVMLIEYPGYGRSQGSPSERSIAEAFEAGYDWLESRDDVDGRRIVGVGRSLGSGAVTALSGRRPLAALVLMSAFVSVGDLALRTYFLPGFLALDRFDNREAVGRFRGPILIVHGRNDAQIPFRHARVLADAAVQAELVALDCGHNDCPPSWAEFVDLVAEFVERAGAAAP